MFNCDFCGKTAKPGTPCATIVTKRETIEHPARAAAHRFRAWVVEFGIEKRKIETRDDPGGIGWRIVEEKKACPSCADFERWLQGICSVCGKQRGQCEAGGMFSSIWVTPDGRKTHEIPVETNLVSHFRALVPKELTVRRIVVETKI